MRLIRIDATADLPTTRRAREGSEPILPLPSVQATFGPGRRRAARAAHGLCSQAVYVENGTDLAVRPGGIIPTLTARRYRFGFVLSTGAGNLTRYENLHKYVARDPEVEAVWAPDPGRPDPSRLATLRGAAPVLTRLGRLDAVMFHCFEPYVLAALRRTFRRRPLLVWSKDDAPSPDPRLWWHYGLTRRPAWRARARFLVDRFCASRVDLFLPFTRSAGDALIHDCGVAPARVHAVNVGVDLELWPPREREESRPPRVLFVGGSFRRKGGDLLLDVFCRRLAGDAELHLVTREAPRDLPAGVVVHDDLVPNDPRLVRLFGEAAVVALPTRSDFVPHAILEAMAAGAPVVSSRVGGIPDLVQDGATGFLIEPDDGDALAARLAALLGDPLLRRRMGAAARARVERDFDARRNVARILELMKRAVDQGLT